MRSQATGSTAIVGAVITAARQHFLAGSAVTKVDSIVAAKVVSPASHRSMLHLPRPTALTVVRAPTN